MSESKAVICEEILNFVNFLSPIFEIYVVLGSNKVFTVLWDFYILSLFEGFPFAGGFKAQEKEGMENYFCILILMILIIIKMIRNASDCFGLISFIKRSFSPQKRQNSSDALP